MANYNTAQRKQMAADGRAMKDGSYPIDNCQDAENAIRDLGRGSNTPTVRGHIKKRVAELKCTGSFFDNWR